MTRIFFARELDTVATYWRVTRRDGVALGFTTHDRDLWFDGLLHRAAPGMLPSAIRRTAGLADDPAEITGALSHESIAAADLAAGRFDDARVTVGAVDWQTLVRAALYTGSIGTVSRESSTFGAELRSAKADLEIDPIPRTSPTCRARFCDSGCTLSPARFTHRAQVTAVDLDSNALAFSLPDSDAFADGELRLLDGPQAGADFSIIDVAGAMLLLDRPLLAGVQIGQNALLREGCDHTIATCASRFGNAVNFQGEPYLPGNDMLFQYPVPR
ncbi:MAG: DUF2163 domain-containing protein [Qipengyuania sp.]